jgi:cytosine/adenosine deaminase-related metal-dependent hydrolase
MSNVVSFLASHIIVGDDMEILKDTAINVSDGKILSIAAPMRDANLVDLGNSIISPMFINTHCHLGDTGAKELGIGLPLEQVVNPPDGLKHKFLANLDPDLLQHQINHGLKEMLEHGIIACADFREQGLKGIEIIKNASIDLPINAIILGRMTESKPYQETWDEAIDILKNSNGLGIRDIEAYPIFLIKDLRELFPEKIFSIHISESFEAEQKSKKEYGVGQAIKSLEFSPDLLVHLTHTSKSELDTIASSQTKAVCCPRANSILGDGLPDVASWIQAGIEFSIGTDNLMFSSPDMFREMDFLSRMLRGLHKNPAVLDTREIFKAATINGAKALKIDHKLGSLTPGKEASFNVINLDSQNLTYTHDPILALVHRANINDIRNIYIKGEKFL